MAVDLSKVMDLADGLEIYKDLRDRIKNIPVPEVPVEDVQINETSILQNGIANIPIAGPDQLGVLKVGSGTRGVNVSTQNNELQINFATAVLIKSGTNTYCPITPKYVDAAAFYGLASAAGKPMSSVSGATVGVYPDDQKQAILKMLGLDGILGDFENSTASKAYAIGETFVYNGKRYRATAAIAVNDVIAPGTNCVLDPLNSSYILRNAISVNDGLYVKNNGGIAILASDTSLVKTGSNNSRPITAYTAKDAAFFGLSKAAGVDLANETVTVGTYPATAKAAILAMLGAVGKTDIAGSTGETKGIAYFNGNYGVAVNSETGGVYISKPSDDVVKAGANDYKPIVPSIQHKSVFYALAKLAGVDLANGSDVVGVYPQNAKDAIQTMLGIEADIPLVETVTGATASITGMPNVRYICDTAISELTITPPASGSIVVRFTAGSNCIVSLPQTVKLPEWFDISSLEAGTTYELIITDGVYGGVMSWAA